MNRLSGCIKLLTLFFCLVALSTQTTLCCFAEDKKDIRHLEAKISNIPTIVSIHADGNTHELVFQINGGFFEPLLSTTQLDTHKYQVIIQGDPARLDTTLAEHLGQVSNDLASRLDGVSNVEIQHTEDNVMSFVLTMKEKMQPQVRSNTGSLVTIVLMNKGRPVVEKAPDMTPPTKSGMLAQRLEYYDITGPHFSIYSALQDSKVDGAVKQAWQQFIDGKSPASAILNLRGYIDEHPEDLLAKYLLARIYLRQGQDYLAIKYLNQLIDSEPGFIQARQDLARLYMAANKPEEATIQLERLEALKAETSEFFLLKGMLAEGYGDYEKAKGNYLKALELDQDNATAHLHLAKTALKQGDAETSEAELRYLIAMNPHDKTALSLLAQVYAQTGQHHKASQLLTSFFKTDDLLSYADLLYQQHGKEEAQKLYSLVENLANKEPEVLLKLGRTYMDHGNEEQARTVLDRYIDLTIKQVQDPKLHEAQKLLKQLEKKKEAPIEHPKVIRQKSPIPPEDTLEIMDEDTLSEGDSDSELSE